MRFPLAALKIASPATSRHPEADRWTSTSIRVGFHSGSARLTPESRRQIANIAAVLRTYPKTTVIVAGHADNVGSEPPNLALSRARAETVAWELRKGGVAADRVQVKAYGSEKPMADNSSEQDGRKIAA